MTKSLFKEFEDVSSKAWKQKIQVDLKGADYNDTLIWNTYDGIDVKPFYHPDEFSESPIPSNSKSTEWKIGQTIIVENENKANHKAIDALQRGAESIIFVVEDTDVKLKELLKNISPQDTSLEIILNKISNELITQIKSVSTQYSNLNFHFDIIGHLGRTGNWFSDLNSDHLNLESLVNQNNHLSIDTKTYQNSGANNVQQLAYAIAHANEYLNHFDSVLDSAAKENLRITFQVAVGSNYFFEIAKIRALRQLWSVLGKEYGMNPECRILSVPSKRNKTIYDYNVNMLRTTTECMSAILGGSNIVSNLPYDALYHEDNEFGSRIARNQLLVLKHESYFNKVDNPADGTYYIENLTTQLAEKALTLFKNIESNSGFLSQLKSGIIQKKIKEVAAKEQADFDTGKLVLLGTNKHPNHDDKMKDELDKQPFLQHKSRKTLIEPIIQKRLSEELEMNRLKEEQN